MSVRRRYRRQPTAFVTAVRLDLVLDGLTYEKWGGLQRAKRGDWLVDNQGDVYTVDADVFARTYTALSPGMYLKTTPIWAERADAAGHVATKEGATAYGPGDYLVFNEVSGGDGYAMTAAKFDQLYELDE